MPTEAAARDAAADLVAMGHRLTAIRVHDHFRFEPSNFWYGKPSTDPELEGWWQTFSLAVYSGHDRMAFEPLFRSERVGVAQVARTHGGFYQGCSEGHAETLERVFTRTGLFREQDRAEVPVPTPLPAEPARPPAAPPWPSSELGEPGVVVQAVVAAAQRLYCTEENAPAAVAWLLTENFAFGEPYETAYDFLGDLADAVAHQGTCTDTTVEAIPFLAELIRDDAVPVACRLILLDDLLRLSVTGPSLAVSLADRTAALGTSWQESAADELTRRAIGRELASLLTLWGRESEAVRFTLAVLAAVCGYQGWLVRSRLDELHVPEGTGRAEIVALVTALADADEDALAQVLGRLSAWLPHVEEEMSSLNVPLRDLALAVLPDLVMGEIESAIGL
ncbi:hypothetical protein AB0G73_36235 [Streptomyces sp. NPDC020719]|uniref:hypothetical protein n=1 Tax=Streptomyces sp. NPDC020719 TaxID=3154896 RepID=UPI00340B9A07